MKKENTNIYAVELAQLGVDLKQIDDEKARIIINNAQQTAQAVCLQNQIDMGLNSGELLDGKEVFEELRDKANNRLED